MLENFRANVFKLLEIIKLMHELLLLQAEEISNAKVSIR